jgi:hypothetical protein
MLRKGWICLACALIAAPLLFSVNVISGEAAWMFFLGVTALIIVLLVFREQGGRRPSPASLHLGSEMSTHQKVPASGEKR